MGEEYSHAHAACLATQLPKGSRCRKAEDPHDEWSDEAWALWRIERAVNLLRWSFIKYEGEETPKPFPYPGQKHDQEIAHKRFEIGKSAVDAAFDMSGGGNEH